jgi:hypothetical protein
MADFSQPVLADAYAAFLTLLKATISSVATLFNGSDTNIPANAIRYNRADDKFQEYLASVWTDKVLSIAGGGTGAATASAARSALGLGTMATQNNNAVNITGGSVVPDTAFTVKCNIAMDSDNSYNLGSSAKQVQKGYFKTALVIPVGANKYDT